MRFRTFAAFFWGVLKNSIKFNIMQKKIYIYINVFFGEYVDAEAVSKSNKILCPLKLINVMSTKYTISHFLFKILWNKNNLMKYFRVANLQCLQRVNLVKQF